MTPYHSKYHLVSGCIHDDGWICRDRDLGSHQAKQLKLYKIVDMKGAYRGQ